MRKVDAEHPVPIDDAEAAAEGAQERKLGEDAVELDFGWHPEHRLETNDTAPMRVGDQGGTPSAAALRGKPHAELSDTRQMAQDLGENTVGKAMLSLLKKNDSLTFGCKTGGISLRCR